MVAPLAPADRPAAITLPDDIVRSFLSASAVAAVLALLAHGLLAPPGLPVRLRAWILIGYIVLALGCLGARRLRGEALHHALLALALAAFGAIGLAAWRTGWGLSSPGLTFVPVIVGASVALTTRRRALLIGAAALVVVALLVLAQARGWHGAPRADDAVPLALRAAILAAGIGVAALVGLRLGHLVERHLRHADERERRFRELLGIAASAYWEIDAELRVRHLTMRNAAGRFVPLELGRTPQRAWELPQLTMEPEAHDLFLAALQRHESFRDLAMQWQLPDGRRRQLLSSGEPRFDAQRRFIGVWGVSRDVTPEQRSRETLRQTELRYQHLFTLIPTPLLVHREGRIVDANAAAVTLFGYGGVNRMIGRELAELYPASGLPQLRERLAALDALPIGQALAPVELDLRSRDGRALHVLATGLRIESGGEPAVLAFYVDETEHHASAQASRASEALLRQVVSMSPDIITLTDLSSGRYVMANDSFCRITGFAHDEVIGRSSVALGIWRDPADRERLLAALAENGSVRDLALDFVAKDGRVLPLLVSATRFERGDRSFLVLNSRDMTQAHRERLEREAILVNASVGIAVTRERRFVMANPHFEHMFGWQPGALVGQPGRAVWCSDAQYDEIGRRMIDALRRGDPVELEDQAMRFDGTRFTVRVRAKAIDPHAPGAGGTIWIAEDVTAKRLAEQELARARDAAEAASQAKSAFLANTSHEIRTPLNGLVGLARLARQPGVAPERLSQYLEQIGDAADTLSLLISDILDLSKIEAGRLEVESSAFDLKALLQTLERAYGALADDHGLAFGLDVESELPAMVRGDALRLRQILANYLQNALKFTARGGIRLRVRARPDARLRFEVHDSGEGIDAATQARLFMPFTQADDSITRRFGGTGLGLSICRQLAELMGGSVGVQSTPGRGSCFHVELPLPEVGPDDPASGHGLPEAELLRGARVLLVEDNEVNMMIAVALLEQWEIVAEQAVDGREALAMLAQAAERTAPIDVVLMDVQMPGISGYEATRELRRRWSAAELPVIALTAAALESERERALTAGMTDFVTKPIDARRLREALLRALTKA